MKILAAVLLGASMTASGALAHPPQAAAQPQPAQQGSMQHGPMRGGMQGMSHDQMMTPEMMRGGMQGMAHEQMMTPEMMRMRGGPAGREYMDAMMRMQQGMMAAQDSDPARQWAMMMIPHHQGAVDTARIVLRHSQDRELRAIAQRTIEGQGRDIAELRSWLEQHPARGGRR